MSEPQVAHFVYDLIRGGTEGQCARIAMGLERMGLSHKVVVFHRRGYFLEEVEDVCGSVHEVAIRHMVRPSTVVEFVRLVQWLKREKIDILHAWDADAAIFGQFAAQWAGIKLVTSRRDLGQIYSPYKLALMRRADRMAARVVANAQAVRDHFVGQGLAESKIVVLPNLLDLADFDTRAQLPFSQAMRLLPGRRMVVVNRLDAEKNTRLLIEALPMVRERIADAVLIIAGDGPEMGMLRELASRLGVEDAICFLGEITDVPALLHLCEVGALVPLRNEGLSNTILEYMAAQLPVLATDCGGNRELVKDRKSCRIVSTFAQADEVATAWIDLLLDQAVAATFGKKNRAQVESNHSPKVVLTAFEKFYFRLGSELEP